MIFLKPVPDEGKSIQRISIPFIGPKLVLISSEKNIS